MKILVLDVHNPNYDHIAVLSEEGKRNYCQMHGYDFISHSFESLDPPHRGPTWGRVAAIKQYLPCYDWILYLDTDVVLTNYTITVESQLPQMEDLQIGRMPDYDTGIPNHISTSALLVKRSDWLFEFLDRWYAQEQFIDKPYFAPPDKNHLSTWGRGGLFFEQSAFHYMYDNFEDVRQHVKVMPGAWFNDRESSHAPSSFLIHFARQDGKLERMRKFLAWQKSLI